MYIEYPIKLGGVYYLETQNSNMNPIAVRPEITPPHSVSWEDTSHGRTISFTKILVDGHEIRKDDKLPEKIEIIDANGSKYVLIKLTTKIFNEKLKDLVGGGKSLNFKDDDELQNYFLKTDFYSAG